jgi:membrane-associated phospholipid phosphatase
MDYPLYHAVNELVVDYSWIGRAFNLVESWSVPLLVAATFALWLFARPGSSRKWKLACASALASSGIALLINQLIARMWDRARPFVAHPGVHVWGTRSHDPSFPSDHASAAFGIAFAVFLFDRLVGSIFLTAACAIGVGRVFIGAHYPSDVVAGCLVGLASALLVVRVLRPLIERIVRLVERLTDPLLAPLWRQLPSR